MSTSLQPLSLTPEERAAFGSMVTSDPPKPAPPAAPTGSQPPAQPPAPPAAPAATPAAGQPPATPPAAPAGEPITLEALTAIAKASMEAVQRIESTMPKAPDPAQLAAAQARQDEMARREQILANVQDPAIAESLRLGFEAKDRADRLEQRIEANDLQLAAAQADQEQAEALMTESQELLTHFPSLTEADLKKCWDRIGSDPAARRMTLWRVAETTLGVPYLMERRNPPGTPAGGPPAPPTPPPATVVTMGAGGGSPPAPPASTSTSEAKDVRQIMAGVLADPAQRAMLGKFGP